jgi:hypothetical protein
MKQQAQATQQEKRQAELQVCSLIAAGLRHSSLISSSSEGGFTTVAEEGWHAVRLPYVYVAGMLTIN